MRTHQQKARLIRLAEVVETRDEPLGVGLKHQCWAGIAIEMAKAEGFKSTDYFGLSFRELKQKIKLNNVQFPEFRNAVMATETRALAAR
jgi:hypothetical protein